METRLKEIARRQKALQGALKRAIRDGGSNELLMKAADVPTMEALYQRMSRLGVRFTRAGVQIALTPEEVLHRRDHVKAQRRARRAASR